MLADVKTFFDGWWLSKSAFDRRILRAAAVILVGAVWFVLIWSPLQDARRAIRLEIVQIDTARAEFARLPPGDATQLPTDTDIRDRLTTTASEQGLAVSSLETRDGRTVLAFETVAFDTLAGWLSDLELNQSVTVVAARVDRRPEPGTVSAEIELEER